VIGRQPSVGSLGAALASLHIPALVVVGAGDRMSLAPSRALAAALPDARLVVVEGAGHVVNLAAPAAFNAALDGFLREAA
jgi:3-oxoadipate enol-lactonase